MGLSSELKTFLLRGNVVDMAVGIVVGAAFGKVVTSFVNDILMPPISLLLGNTNFSDLKIVLRKRATEGMEIVTPAITWNYGNFFKPSLIFLLLGQPSFCD